MPKEQIEFTIRPDGSVEETTRGLKGPACEQVTAALEQALGEVVSRSATAERYESAEGEHQHTMGGRLRT
jgi:hypothetical protein